MKKFLLLTNLLVCFTGFGQDWNSIDFDVLSAACPIAVSNEIYLSEIYDCQSGGYALIELYNPTNSPITLTGIYRLRKHALPVTAPPPSILTINLIGTIPPNSPFVFAVPGGDAGSDSCLCPDAFINQTTNNLGFGINAQDKIELLKNSDVIDTWIEINNVVGYSYIRKANAAAPKIVHDSNDWSYSNQGNNTVGCSEIGSHSPVTITNVDRTDDTMCSLPAMVRIIVEGGSGQYERSVNGSSFVNHVSPWAFNIPTGGTITVVIRNKLEPECSETISFYIDPNPNPTTSPVIPL